jgi:hypothetical protein
VEVVSVSDGLELMAGRAPVHLERAVGPKIWVKADSEL